MLSNMYSATIVSLDFVLDAITRDYEVDELYAFHPEEKSPSLNLILKPIGFLSVSRLVNSQLIFIKLERSE